MTQNKIKNKLNELLKSYGLSEWQIAIKMDCMFELGKCEYDINSKSAIIRLNENLNDEEIVKTLKHEVLHLCLAQFVTIARIYLDDEKAIRVLEHEEEMLVLKLTDANA